jgi:hypothetical protein
MSRVTMIISIDFIGEESVREPLTINIVTTGPTASDETLTEIVADEVKQHLAKHDWQRAK